jgi:hypothetical protein
MWYRHADAGWGSAAVRHSDLCRFLSYAENREIVRDVLQEHGLKKVKLGMEAYVHIFAVTLRQACAL